jgi:tRNA pseudouridine38-40 synthase
VSGKPKIVALWCWYRGSEFYGYQQQEARRTVQGELLKAFPLAGLERNPVVAGRTDKFVSARMQVLSARLEPELPPDELTARLNAVLPKDIGIHLARFAKRGFHAAWSANSKEYRYALTHEQAGDLNLLREVAALIPGTHNFKTFHFKTSEEKPRTVHSVELMPTETGVTLRFIGEGFARYMVRMLVGGMTVISRGLAPMELFKDGLFAQKNFKCPTAPPEPLTLWNVGYPPELDPFTAEERSAFAWSEERSAVSVGTSASVSSEAAPLE